MASSYGIPGDLGSAHPETPPANRHVRWSLCKRYRKSNRQIGGSDSVRGMCQAGKVRLEEEMGLGRFDSKGLGR